MSGAGRVLVLNAGSSSLKYQVVDPASGAAPVHGIVERIGSGSARLTHHDPRASARVTSKPTTTGPRWRPSTTRSTGPGSARTTWSPSATGWCTAGRA